MTDAVVPNRRSRALPARWVSGFSRTARRFAVLHAIGLFTFLLSYPVSEISGTRPDFGVVMVFGYFIGLTLAIFAGSVFCWKIGRMMLIERPDSPSRALVTWVFGLLRDNDRVFNILHMLFAVSLFSIGFAVLKGAIAVLSPFAWDQTFLLWDRAVHFGALPHEYLWGLLDIPFAVAALNFFYNLWYLMVMFCFIVAGSYGRAAHIQYLIAFMLTWLIPGFLMAVMFSSAGPAFYERAGFGTEYASLMTALRSISASTDLAAIATQDILWEGFTGERPGSVGISAFPSVHVATATLIALYASRGHYLLAGMAWAFLGLIMLGSVVLAWHYAVDGYAGIALALVFWKIGGWLIPQADRNPS